MECKKDEDDPRKRKESHKVRDGSIKLIDNSLSYPAADWRRRSDFILPLQSKSIEELYDKWDEDRTSLGLIRPKEVSRLVFKQKTSQIDSTEQLDVFGEEIPLVDPLSADIKYVFTCADNRCTGHTIMCEDWELGESWRKQKRKHGDGDVLHRKIREHFLDYMINERDLYFYMGLHYIHPEWLIIGLYYPPKQQPTSDGTDK